MLVSRFADKNCNCNRPQLAGLAAQYPRHSQYQIICREASWLHVARSGSVCLHLYKSSTQATHQYAPPNQPSSGHSTRSSLHLNIEDKQIFIYDQRYINEQNRNQIFLYFDHKIKHIKQRLSIQSFNLIKQVTSHLMILFNVCCHIHNYDDTIIVRVQCWSGAAGPGRIGSINTAGLMDANQTSHRRAPPSRQSRPPDPQQTIADLHTSLTSLYSTKKNILKGEKLN